MEDKISESSKRLKAWTLEWDNDNENFIVTSHYGKLSQTIGRYESGRYVLEKPEGMYLLECGRAEVGQPLPLSFAFPTYNEDAFFKVSINF